MVWVPYSESVFYSISAECIHGINVDIFTNLDRNNDDRYRGVDKGTSASPTGKEIESQKDTDSLSSSNDGAVFYSVLIC